MGATTRTALAPAARDEDGKVIRADWTDGQPFAPDPAQGELALSEQPAFTPQEQAEIRGETPGSFDELHPNAQATFRDQAGLDQAFASVAKIKANMGDDFAEMDDDFEELPSGAQMVVAALLSVDWKPHGPEVLGDALDQLMDTLPLTDEAELREFLEDHGFIEE